MSAAVHQLILASAGTGKTYQLTSQFLGLLFAGVEPERILATTFTRKAAGEILDRILERLVEATEDAKKRAELAGALGRSDVTAERCHVLLSSLARSLDTFQVRTIDSFFVHLVRLFGLDLELPPGWSISSEAQDEALRAEAMQDVLEHTPHDVTLELLRNLGSGGYGRDVHRSMLEQVKQMRSIQLESADGAWEWLDPGTKPSDEELQAALEALSIADLPTNQKGKPNGHWVNALNKLVESVREPDWDSIFSLGLGRLSLTPGGTYQRFEMPAGLAEKLEPIVQRAIHQSLSQLAARNRATRALLERFELAYSELKRSRSAYRFDDLPLALSPQAEGLSPIETRELDIWYRLDSRIDHLLLDEFQDTSPLQWRILQRIASEIAADGTGERTFFCVGDLKQSIYGFRQAEPRLLAELPRLLPGLEVEAIHESWRSSHVVLELVNCVFADVGRNPVLGREDQGPFQVGARRWQQGFQPHEAARELPGTALLVEAREREEGEDQSRPLLDRVVARALAIVAEAPHASVGILLRERKHIPSLIYRLRLEGVDASGEGGSTLVDSEAVLAFVSLLHLADHPDDSAAAFHVASSPLGACVDLPPESGDERRHALAREIRARLLDEGLGAVCAEMGRRVAADEGWSAWDRARFEQLTELAFAFGAKAGLRPSEFIDHVRHERVESPGGAPVRVMTIHGAKGLEFDAVILPELQRRFVARRGGLLVERPRPEGEIERVSVSPRQALLIASSELASMYDDTTARLFEDDLCNLYVAMTRAARRLELIVPWREPGEVGDGGIKAKAPTIADFVRAALPQQELHEPDAEGVVWRQASSASGAGWAAGLEGGAAERAGSGGEADAISLGLAESRRPRSLPRRSPSAEEGGRLVRADSLLRDKTGAKLGTLVHRLLEDLIWLEDFELDEARASAAIASLEPDPELRRSAVATLAQSLVAEPVRAALSRAGCPAPAGVVLEVANERAFSLLLQGEAGEEQLWSGVIDRLVLGRRGDEVVFAQVLDYKTDSISAAELAERVAHYRPQLQSYGRVVAAQTGLLASAIELRLVFLVLGEVVDIEAA